MSEDKQKTEEEIRAAKEAELAAASQEIPQSIDPKIDETIDSTGLEIADEIAPDTEAPIDKDALLQTMEAQGADPVVVRELERTLTGEETPQQVLNKARGNAYLQAAIVFIAFMLALVAAPGTGHAEGPSPGEGIETANLEGGINAKYSYDKVIKEGAEARENGQNYTVKLKSRHSLVRVTIYFEDPEERKGAMFVDLGDPKTGIYTEGDDMYNLKGFEEQMEIYRQRNLPITSTKFGVDGE